MSTAPTTLAAEPRQTCGLAGNALSDRVIVAGGRGGGGNVSGGAGGNPSGDDGSNGL